MSSLVIHFTPHQRLRDPNLDEVTTKETQALYERSGDQKDSSLLLMPCSLVIFKDQAYSGKIYVIDPTLFEFIVAFSFMQ
jgi:hypothetical protein